MKYLILASLLILSIACNKDKDKDDKSKPGKDTPVTDTSICNGPVPPGTTIFSNPWIVTEMYNINVKQSRRLIVNTNSVTLLVTCSSADSLVDAGITVQSRINGNSLTILSSAEDIKEFEVNGEKLNCISSLTQGTQARFSFQGPCLKIITDNNQQLFTPVK